MGDVSGAKGGRAKDEDGRRDSVQAEVVPELIVGPLQEGRVDAEDGPRACAGESGHVAHGVLLGDAHVDEAPARALSELGREAHDVGRGGVHRDDARVGLHPVRQQGAGNVGVVLVGGVRGGAGAHCPRGNVKGHGVVPSLRVCRGRRVAMALLGVDVEDHGMVCAAQFGEGNLQRGDVMAVLEVAVVESERAEHVVLRGPLGGTQVGERAIDAAAVGRDRPLVVVDHNDQAAAELDGVVQALEGKAAGEGPVADDGHHVVRLTREVACRGEAAGEADRGRGVAHREEVMLGLPGVGEARGLRVASGVEKRRRAAGEHLVRIGLMRDVEDDFVVRGLEDAVQGDGQLDRGEVGASVPADRRGALDDCRAHLVREGRERGGGEGTDALGRVDVLEIHGPPPSPLSVALVL